MEKICSTSDKKLAYLMCCAVTNGRSKDKFIISLNPWESMAMSWLIYWLKSAPLKHYFFKNLTCAFIKMLINNTVNLVALNKKTKKNIQKVGLWSPLKNLISKCIEYFWMCLTFLLENNKWKLDIVSGKLFCVYLWNVHIVCHLQ